MLIQSLVWRSIVLAVPLVGAATLAGAQTTWYVDAANTGPGSGTLADPYASIQFAIDQSATLPGDTVLVEYGEYAEQVDFRGKAITVEGVPEPGTGNRPAIRPPAGSGVLFQSGEGPGSVLNRMLVREGSATLVGAERLGGGILIRGASPTLMNTRVRNCEADRGGGIAVIEEARPRLESVRVDGNTASVGAGVLVEGAGLHWTGGSIEANPYSLVLPLAGRPVGGGLAAFASTVHLKGIAVQDHSNTQNMVSGGGLYACSASDVQAVDCTITGNTADGSGGGGSGPIRYLRCTLEGNRSGLGGGVYGGSLVECLLVTNRGFRGGGAAFSSLERCVLEWNSPAFSGQGGGAYRSNLVDCVLRNNYANLGGGIFGGSALRTRFERNSVGSDVSLPLSGLGGGAMHARLERCVFWNNRASAQGAGAWIGDAPSGGSAESSGSALHCTFLRNPDRGSSAPAGAGALYAGPGAGPISHCLFEGNGAEGLVAPSGALVEYCCLQEPQPGPGNFVAKAFVVSSGSLLAYDANLVASSPCIDTGDPARPPDPDGSVADIGALPFDPTYVPEPVEYCGSFSPAGCSATESATGDLLATGTGILTLTVRGFDGAAAGYLLYGLDPAQQSIPIAGQLCVQGPSRSSQLFSTPGSPIACSSSLDLVLELAEVTGLGPQTLYVQAAAQIAGQLELSRAYEVALQP